MYNKIHEEVIKALKDKNTFRMGVLKLVKAELLNNKNEPKPRPEEEIIAGFYKKIAKNLEIPDIQAKSPEFYEKTQKELEIIKEFMPKSLTEEELKSIITKHLSLGNMGAIMKAVKDEIAATGALFDGKTVSSLVNQMLK